MVAIEEATTHGDSETEMEGDRQEAMRQVVESNEAQKLSQQE
jgi:hypothetical protein